MDLKQPFLVNNKCWSYHLDPTQLLSLDYLNISLEFIDSTQKP